MPSSLRSSFGEVDVEIDGFIEVWPMSTLPVSPATRLIAPGDEGPNVVP